MNESIGGSLLLSLVVIVVGCMIAIFTTSFAYTKAYRAKSIIIKTIEDNNGYADNLIDEIDSQLTNMGYRKSGKTCSVKQHKALVYPVDNSKKSSFCIYKISEVDEYGNTSAYYEVQTYMYFDIPLISFSLPVKGQTISFRETMINVENNLNMEG